MPGKLCVCFSNMMFGLNEITIRERIEGISVLGFLASLKELCQPVLQRV